MDVTAVSSVLRLRPPHAVTLPPTPCQSLSRPYSTTAYSCASPQRQHQMQRRPSLKVVLCRCLLVRPRAPVPMSVTCSHGITSLLPCSPRPATGTSEGVPFDSHLLPAIDQPLLYRRDALLLFHALLDALHFVVGLDVEFDLFPCEGADSVRKCTVSRGARRLETMVGGSGWCT